MSGPGLRTRRRRLTAAWERFHDTGDAPGVRSEVAASWDRSQSALPVPVEAAPIDPQDAVTRAWAGSPLRSAVAEVTADMDSIARQCDLVAVVTDASGRILWSTGSHHMQDRAAAVNFVPGGRWDEASVGTNAVDLALRTGEPAMVFSAEHFSPVVHGWVCYAAPVVDRSSGSVLGVLDLSTTWDRSHPMAMATVTALARTVSQTVTAAAVPQPRRPVRPYELVEESAEPLRLDVLGRPRLWQGGVALMLTPRQAELLLALASHPSGLTLDQLAAHVYGDQPVGASTVKAEVSRLRRVLPGVVASRPYRLAAPVVVDAFEVLDRVRAGDALAAARSLTDDLLPVSESPLARELGVRLSVAVRALVLRATDPEAAAVLAAHRRDDLEVVDHALRLLHPRAPERALLEGVRAAGLLL